MSRPATFRPVLEAELAQGAKTIEDLSNATGRSRSAVYSSLSKMEAMGIVCRVGTIHTGRQFAYRFALRGAP